MKHQKKIIILVFIVITILSCADKSTKISYREIMKQLPVFHLSNYPYFNPKSPLVNRIVDPPDFILTFLKAIDGVDNYQAYIPTHNEITLCAEYLEKLPEVHKKTLQERLVGIYFIENFTGSGMADFVLDEEEKIYCNLFINPETMRNDMTTWLTYRENSCYIKRESEISIIQDCGTEYTGLMYLLLHETTHIVDYIYSVTPYVDEAIKEIFNKKLIHTPFTKNIWDTYETPVREYDFKKRTEVTFYGFSGGPKINIQDAEALYKRCKKTPFTSLYAARNWAEDWAESVTWYYFTNVLNQPYEIQVYKDDMLISSFKPMEWEKVKERIPVVLEILNNISGLL